MIRCCLARPPGPRVEPRGSFSIRWARSDRKPIGSARHAKGLCSSPLARAMHGRKSEPAESGRLRSFRRAAATPAERLTELLAELGRRRMTNVLVEGGSQLLGSLWDAPAIDEILRLHRTRKFSAAAAPPARLPGRESIGLPTPCRWIDPTRATVRPRHLHQRPDLGRARCRSRCSRSNLNLKPSQYRITRRISQRRRAPESHCRSKPTRRSKPSFA